MWSGFVCPASVRLQIEGTGGRVGVGHEAKLRPVASTANTKAGICMHERLIVSGAPVGMHVLVTFFSVVTAVTTVPLVHLIVCFYLQSFHGFIAPTRGRKITYNVITHCMDHAFVMVFSDLVNLYLTCPYIQSNFNPFVLGRFHLSCPYTTHGCSYFMAQRDDSELMLVTPNQQKTLCPNDSRPTKVTLRLGKGF